jgi:phospholipid/cholesterol/gamma-HCH transport system ATP-binding protein
VSDAPIIEMSGVRLAHSRAPGVSMIEGIDWTVRPGDFWVVAGLQGSGKSMLLETAAGLHPQSAGSVRLFGQPVTGSEGDELFPLRRRVGLVFDGAGRLFPGLTVFENLALPWCYHHNAPLGDAVSALGHVIEALSLDRILDVAPSRLGRAWARRVALGRALALQPEVLLLDNPLAGLDTAHLRWWRQFLAQARLGHAAAGGRPLTLVTATDELRPLIPLGTQFALVHQRRWMPLGGPDAVRQCHEPILQEILGEPA